MITPAQCRAARGWLNKSQEELAKEAGVSRSTLREFEAGDRVPIANNMIAIERALTKLGMSFTDNGLIFVGEV